MKTWIFGPSPRPAGRFPSRSGAHVHIDGRSNERSRIDRSAGVGLDRRVQTGRAAQDADRGDVLEGDARECRRCSAPERGR